MCIIQSFLGATDESGDIRTCSGHDLLSIPACLLLSEQLVDCGINEFSEKWILPPISGVKHDSS